MINMNNCLEITNNTINSLHANNSELEPRFELEDVFKRLNISTVNPNESTSFWIKGITEDYNKALESSNGNKRVAYFYTIGFFFDCWSKK